MVDPYAGARDLPFEAVKSLSREAYESEKSVDASRVSWFRSLHIDDGEQWHKERDRDGSILFD
jgi:hypothetical protein